MSAAMAITISPLPMTRVSSPKTRACRVSAQYAPARPTAYAIPYQYSEKGPTCSAIAFGIQSIMAAECRRDALDHPIPTRALSFRPMAEFQWWLLLVGLVAGGGLVAIVSMDSRRHEDDLAEAERRAEATWIADRLYAQDPSLDRDTVQAVLRMHREYLALPAPDRLVIDGRAHSLDGRPLAAATAGWDPSGDADPDQVADDIGDDRGRRTDEDLPPA